MAAAVAAAVADTPGKLGNHPEAVPALAAAEAAEHCVRASVAAAASKRSSGSQATFAGLENSSLASAAVAAAVAVAAAHMGRNRRRQRACLRNGGCLWATRSRLCRVLAGCPSLGCGCCEGGLGLESRRKVEVRWGRRGTVLRRLAVVLACGRRRRVVVLAIGPERLRE